MCDKPIIKKESKQKSTLSVKDVKSTGTIKGNDTERKNARPQNAADLLKTLKAGKNAKLDGYGRSTYVINAKAWESKKNDFKFVDAKIKEKYASNRRNARTTLNESIEKSKSAKTKKESEEHLKRAQYVKNAINDLKYKLQINELLNVVSDHEDCPACHEELPCTEVRCAYRRSIVSLLERTDEGEKKGKKLTWESQQEEEEEEESEESDADPVELRFDSQDDENEAESDDCYSDTDRKFEGLSDGSEGDDSSDGDFVTYASSGSNKRKSSPKRFDPRANKRQKTKS